MVPKVIDLNTGEIWAVKEIKATAQDDKWRMAFKREVEIIAPLRHVSRFAFSVHSRFSVHRRFLIHRRFSLFVLKHPAVLKYTIVLKYSGVPKHATVYENVAIFTESKLT
jgi:hypothetical protein